jgi:hypothetical protein
MLSSGALLRRTLALVLPAALAAACIISSNTRARPVASGGATGRGVTVQTPVKVHLLDGSVAVFRSGITVSADTIHGAGVRYTATLRDTSAVSSIPLDSVLGAETYERTVNPGRTILYSTVVGTVGTAAAVVTIKAIFGSCPTIYSDSAGTPVLEAESFSYSIAPLLAKRDVDRLHAQPDSAGTLRLEIRNEALETHRIDNMEVVEVRHRTDEEAYPEPYGDPLAIAGLAPARSARDRAGRDVSRQLAHADGSVFATDDSTLAGAREGDTDDWIDIAVPRPADGDSVALALRMRSSLLTTVLFYDYMLGRPGALSLDWVGQDLGRITTLARLGRWYTTKLGLRVAVRDGDEYRQVARLVDFGPIAWREVAVVVPAVGDDSVRIRLSFLADEWRIDRVALSSSMRRVKPRVVKLARATSADGTPRQDVRDVLRRADDRQLETHPGDRFFADFDVGRAPVGAGGSRTFLFAAQGYYTEWVRGSWMQSATDSTAFDPSRVKLTDVLRSWRAAKDSMEARFFLQRVPVT